MRITLPLFTVKNVVKKSQEDVSLRNRDKFRNLSQGADRPKYF